MSEPDFSVAKAVLWLLGAVGWIVILAGVVLGAVSLGSGDSLEALFPIAIVAVSGLIVVAIAQLGRTLVTTAECSQAILQELVSLRKEIGKPSQKGHDSPVSSNAPSMSRSLAKIYKDHVIEKSPFGFEVEGKVFKSIGEAENYIDRKAGP